MTEPTIQPPPGARLMFASRHGHARAKSTSPTHLRPPSDDLIAHLSPPTALDAFRAPTGPLKACMDAATPSEKSFAIRAATASKNIYEWLEELRTWSWASKGGLGFQTPYSKRKLSLRGRASSLLTPAEAAGQDTAVRTPENTYIGSLLEADLARYEARIAQIEEALDKLQIDDIKSHVLHNHIKPLSRPGTPASPAMERPFGSMAAASSYTHMDDMTAVITATVLQALPNLAKLAQLMNAWSVRLTVLRRIPAWLSLVEDAESAIQTGWNALQEPTKLQASGGEPAQSSTLSAHDFEVMKLVLEKKVTRAATGVDYMLDSLEGRDDTLPDEWLDRMEKVELAYAEWSAKCEQVLREAAVAAARETQRRIALEQALQDAAEDEPEDGEDTIRVTVDSGVVISVQNADDEPLPRVEETSEGEASSPDENDHDSSVSSLSDSPPSRKRSPKYSGIPRPKANRNSPHTPPRETRSVSLPLGAVPEDPEDQDLLQTPFTSTYSDTPSELGSPIVLGELHGGGNDHMQRQISAILQNLPAKIKLSTQTQTQTQAQPRAMSHLNPPDLQLPHLTKPKPTPTSAPRSKSPLSSRASSRGPTPAFMLAPAPRARHANTGNQDIKMYHLSRANGEAPIKLFIRCVGEHGERVMVRVGGGWADLGEYLKEYAIHHGRRSNHGSESLLEVRDIPSRSASSMSNSHRHARAPSPSPPPGAQLRPSPPSRPGSAMATSPLFVQKKRGDTAPDALLGPRLSPRTPIAQRASPRVGEPPSSSDSGGSASSASTTPGGRSRASSHLSWMEGDDPATTIADGFTLGMAGPRSSRKEIPQESLEWVESIKEKIRAVSGGAGPPPAAGEAKRFGEMGRVGGTKRVFRKAT